MKSLAATSITTSILGATTTTTTANATAMTKDNPDNSPAIISIDEPQMLQCRRPIDPNPPSYETSSSSSPSHRITGSASGNLCSAGLFSTGSPTTALEQYRLHLYNYALHIERFRCPPYNAAAAMAAVAYANNGNNNNGGNNGSGVAGSSSAHIHSGVSAHYTNASTIGAYHHHHHHQQQQQHHPPPLHHPMANGRFALSMSLFPQSIFQPEEPKPQHSYIGLIAMAILSSAEMKLVLSDIYQYILDNYPYFRSRGPGWRNSIRHNLSLNDCFIKSGRSANGKGHYWAIHPANMDDFRKGDFRRRKAQRKVRKHMGLSVDDAGTDSPSPPPLDLSSSPPPPLPLPLPPSLPPGVGLPSAHPLAAAAAAAHHLAAAAAVAVQNHAAIGSYLPPPSRHHPHSHNHHSHDTIMTGRLSSGQQQQPPPYSAVASGSVSFETNSTLTVANMSHYRFINYQQQQNETKVIDENLMESKRIHLQYGRSSRKRQFDVASLLAPDVKWDDILANHHHHHHNHRSGDNDDNDNENDNRDGKNRTTDGDNGESPQQQQQQQQQQHQHQQFHPNSSDELDDIDVVTNVDDDVERYEEDDDKKSEPVQIDDDINVNDKSYMQDLDHDHDSSQSVASQLFFYSSPSSICSRRNSPISEATTVEILLPAQPAVAAAASGVVEADNKQPLALNSTGDGNTERQFNNDNHHHHHHQLDRTNANNIFERYCGSYMASAASVRRRRDSVHFTLHQTTHLQ